MDSILVGGNVFYSVGTYIDSIPNLEVCDGYQILIIEIENRVLEIDYDSILNVSAIGASDGAIYAAVIGGDYEAFQWFDDDNQIVSDTTFAQNLSIGAYYPVVSYDQHCLTYGDTLWLNLSTYTHELIKAPIRVFPNPFKDFVNVLEDDSRLDINEVRIFSIDGKLLFSRRYNESPNEINLAHLPASLLLMQISTSDKKNYRKILMKHLD